MKFESLFHFYYCRSCEGRYKTRATPTWELKYLSSFHKLEAVRERKKKKQWQLLLEEVGKQPIES
ncbi:hypothetical protein IC575_012422 [Cucumis melo]